MSYQAAPSSTSARTRPAAMAALLLVVSCLSDDRSGPMEPRAADSGPAHLISDAVHSSGTRGFFFLPPMVSQPSVTGEFDADIATVNPRVVICDVTDGPDTDCGGATTALRSFTTTSTPALGVDGEKYKVDWDTREGAFVAGRTYRVHVTAGTGPNMRELGFADILLTNEPGKAKNLANDDLIVLKDGRTLPVHFRIEQGLILPPGNATRLELAAPPSTVAGTPISVTVTARDANGQVATGYRGAVGFTSSDPRADLPAEYVFTEGDGGAHTFTGVVPRTAGVVTLRASDATDAGVFGEATVTVQSAAAAKLRLAGFADRATAGAATDLTVTALDEFDNTAAGYLGTVRFTSSDPAAALPGDYAFTVGDAGTHTFSAGVTFKTAGDRSLEAADVSTPGIAGSLAVIVDAAAAAALRFTTQPADALAGENIIPPVVVTAYDAFANIAAAFTGGVTIAIGTNPGSGTLSGTLTRAAAAGVATFDDLRVSGAGTGYTLAASANELTGATSEPFDIIAPIPVEARWINPAGGLWSVGSNWSTGAPPTSEQSAVIDLTGTYTVTLDVNTTVNGLTLGGSSGVQSLTTSGSRTLTLLSSGNVLGTGRLTLGNSTITGSGTLTIAAGGALNLTGSSTVNAPLTNAGTISVFNSSVLNGGVTTVAGSMMRVVSVGFGGATLSVGAGFTNNGVIELTGTATNGVTLSVNGTLLNAAGGTISILPGVGGARTIVAEIDNRGTFSVAAALSLTRPSSGYANSGVITITGGNLTMNLSGAKSFTNTGTVTVAAGRTLAIGGFAPSGGRFTHAEGATLDGGGALSLNGINPASFEETFSLSALTLSSTVASFATNLTTETTALTLSSATVNGPGTITNAAGRTLNITSGTINAPLVNAGTVVAIGAPALNGGVTTAASSLIRVLSVGFGGSSLTVGSGFTNEGAIELTGTATNGVTLTVNGTLVNAAGGTIASLFGVGGTRTLVAQLDNRGTLSVPHSLTVARGSSDHTNSGTIAVTGGTLTFTQSGTTPSFTNAAGGIVTVAAGRSWVMNGGSVTNAAGASIEGQGTMQTNTSAAVTNAGNVTIALARIAGSVASTGSFAPVTTEFLSNTTIPVGAGFSYNNVRVVAAASFAGSVSLAGDLTLSGVGNLTVGAQEIAVAGNFATQNTAILTMQNALGALNVSGGASFGGGSTTGRLTAGTLRVGGNFTQSGGSAAAFGASANHLTVLNGSGAQSVSFANPGTLLSHFHRLEIENASAAGVTLASATFASGQLRTPAGPLAARTLTSAGQTLEVGGLDAAGLVFDATSLRVVNGEVLARFDDAVFRNMDPAATQLRLDRLDGAATFNNVQFLTVPTTGIYLHLVDTDLAAPMFTLTMQGTQPTNHGGRIIESMPGQLVGWPF